MMPQVFKTQPLGRGIRGLLGVCRFALKKISLQQLLCFGEPAFPVASLSFSAARGDVRLAHSPRVTILRLSLGTAATLELHMRRRLPGGEHHAHAWPHLLSCLRHLHSGLVCHLATAEDSTARCVLPDGQCCDSVAAIYCLRLEVDVSLFWERAEAQRCREASIHHMFVCV